MGSCLSDENRSPLPPSPTSPALGIRKRKNSRRRLGSRNSSFDSRREEQLHRIPGRMFVNGSSKVASVFTQQGRKGPNQDAMIVWENFGSRTDTIFCGVFDGHGPHGHMVAKRVRDHLPLKLIAHWEVNGMNNDVLTEISLNTSGCLKSGSTSFRSADEESRASVDVEETEKHLDFFQTLKESFLKTYKVVDGELKTNKAINCFCSGTTAVTIVKQGQELVIGNVGDSRAVMGTRDKDGNLTAVQLTVDLKPNLPVEAERIRKCKGRIFALRDEPEVSRVWLPADNSPGLAMARAFGDFCLKDYGLISVPEISYQHLTEKDEFVVLATDGIWDVLSNKEVVNIVASAPTRSYAARALVESAVMTWKHKYPTSKVDDCAVVCLFFDSNNLSTATAVKPQEKITSMEQNVAGEKEDPSGPDTLNRSGTVRNGGEAVGEESQEEALDESNEDASLYADPEEDWSALEGVSRVDTLLTLPRFVPENEDDEAARGENSHK